MTLDEISNGEQVRYLQERLREVKAELHAMQPIINAAVERAEQAERERDEARRRLERASIQLHEWTHDGSADTWHECADPSCVADRAALGMKP